MISHWRNGVCICSDRDQCHHHGAAQIRQSSENADKASQLSVQSANSASNGNELMAELQSAMKDIENSGHEINNIIDTIESIAEQTNLLALKRGD
ncbi:methyl-accepting chemotaxis protein [Vibrio sp. PP-XX7]